MNLKEIRSQIPATQKVIYLNTGWDGPSPLPVIEAITSYLEYEAREGPTTPPVQERRRELFTEARETVASLLGASPQEVALTESTTAGINIVINGLPWSAGDELLTCTLEHSSGLVPLYVAARRLGLKTHVVALDPQDSAEAIVSKFAEAFTPRTRLLSLSHIAYTTGLVMPMKELCTLAHDQGALVLVDAAQSAGQMPLDLHDLGCDFYALPGHKWLLGPDGTGALYVREDLIERLETFLVSSHAVISYDREGNFEPNPGAIEKFELLTRSTALFSGLTTAIQFLQEAGLEAIREHILSLVDWLKERLRAIQGVSVHSPWTRELSSGLVTFSIAGQPPKYVQETLWQRHHIMCRTIADPPSVRLSVHLFNTQEELERVLQAVEALAEEPPKADSPTPVD